MHLGWVLAAVLCAGCFSKPGFGGGGGTGDGGTGDGGTCTGAWSTPEPITALNNQVTGEPTITGDKLQVYWHVQNTPTSQEIHWASRESASEDFTDRGTVSGLDGATGIDTDPSISDDGLVLVYRIGANEQAAGFREVTRTAADLAWGAPHSLAGLNTIVPASLDLSGDGLTLYYNVSQTLYSATRPTRGAAFTQSTTTLGTNRRFPAISGDELTLYYETPAITSATRSAKTVAFPAGTAFYTDTDLHDVDVTQDGKTLVVATHAGETIAIATRCP
jgi:hypothetical protein